VSFFIMGLPLHIACVLAALMLAVAPARAQYRFTSETPGTTAWPRIDIPVEVRDNSSSVLSLSADSFTVMENGRIMLPLTLDCSDRQIAGRIAFWFIMDVSYSMGFIEGTKVYDNDSLKWRTAKRVFIDAYQRMRPNDLGAVMSFARDVTMECGFTRVRRQLADATYGMALRPGTAIYDAIVQACASFPDSVDQKVIILLTDGVDNSSTATRHDAIATANLDGITVYTIGLGFYPEENDPGRVDADTLRDIAQHTGGRAYITPRSDELDSIFVQMFERIFSFGCTLSYITPDTCRDGMSRIVDLRLRLPGAELSERETYAVDDLRSRLHLVVHDGSTLADDSPQSVPIRAWGELRAGEPLTLRTEVRWDTAALAITGATTSGMLLDGATAQFSTLSPGLAEVTFANAMLASGLLAPDAAGAKPLFALDVTVPHFERHTVTHLACTIIESRQNCEIIPYDASSEIEIGGCPAEVTIAFDSTLVARAGYPFEVPVLLSTPIDDQQALRYDFLVYYDAVHLQWEGVDTRGTMSSRLAVTADETAPGVLRVTAVEGMPVGTRGILVRLRFLALPSKVSCPLDLRLDQVLFAQTCFPAVRLAGARVLLDGSCSQLAVRQAPALTRISPNPAPCGADVTVAALSRDPGRLELFDAFGRSVMLLYGGGTGADRDPGGAAEDAAQSRQQILGTTGLQPGTYFLVLRADGAQRVGKLVLIR
jgi:hypothetical protein